MHALIHADAQQRFWCIPFFSYIWILGDVPGVFASSLIRTKQEEKRDGGRLVGELQLQSFLPAISFQLLENLACLFVTHLQVFPLPLFWNVDCESHSLRFWLPFKVRHIAHSKTGCTSINQSWRHHYKVLLIASMGMGAYSLRQSDSSRHTEIGWINSPSSSLYWTSLLITLLLF